MILKGIFSEMKYECVLFKFSVSSITLTDFRQGEEVILHLPLTQNESLKSPPRLGLTIKKKKAGLKFSQGSVKDREDSKLSRGKIEWRNEDMIYIIRIIKQLQDSGVLADGVTEIVKY